MPERMPAKYGWVWYVIRWRRSVAVVQLSPRFHDRRGGGVSTILVCGYYRFHHTVDRQTFMRASAAVADVLTSHPI